MTTAEREAISCAIENLRAVDSAYLDTLWRGDRTFRSHINEAISKLERILS